MHFYGQILSDKWAQTRAASTRVSHRAALAPGLEGTRPHNSCEKYNGKQAQLLTKCSLLLLRTTPQHARWFSNVTQPQTDALWWFLLRQLKGLAGCSSAEGTPARSAWTVSNNIQKLQTNVWDTQTYAMKVQGKYLGGKAVVKSSVASKAAIKQHPPEPPEATSTPRPLFRFK